MADTFPDGLLSYGQKMTGFTFDPSVDPKLNHMRAMFAGVIDLLDNRRQDAIEGDKAAYTEAIESIYQAYLKSYAAIA